MPFSLPTLSAPTNPSIDPLGGGFMEAYSDSVLSSPVAFTGNAPGEYSTERNNFEAGLGDGLPIWRIKGFLPTDQTSVAFNQRVGGLSGSGTSILQIVIGAVIAGAILTLLKKGGLL